MNIPSERAIKHESSNQTHKLGDLLKPVTEYREDIADAREDLH